MDTITLQVPMSKTLRVQATSVADALGFSSLQEVIRLFLAKLAKRELVLKFEEPTIKLSTRAIKRYNRMDKDFKAGKNFYTANNMEEFIKQLNS